MHKTTLLDKMESGDQKDARDISETIEDVLPSIDPAAAEKKLLRKIDLRLIPILFVLYLCAFIDRVNIGNARIQGLEEDLNMKDDDFNIALFIFFIPYILCEVPSNLLVKNLRPSWYLAGIISSWGIVTIGEGVTQSYGGFVACRFLLGIFEAGFFPGAVYLISMYYKRHELQLRVNLFFCASILSGAFSGLLAYGIAHLDGRAGYSGWRWIFIIEGAATVVIAIVSAFITPDWPHTAKFLTEQERTLLEHRLRLDVEGVAMNSWDKKAAKRSFGDPKIYFGIFMFLGITTTTYSVVFFTPTILKQLGWTSIRAQVMSIPVFVVAALLTLTSALISDFLKQRYIVLLAGCLLAIIGYAILFCMHQVPVGARYFAVYLITSGGFVAQTITIVWLSNNMGGHYKRAVGVAMQVGFGSIAGIIASFIYLPSEIPTYHTGFGTGLGLLIFGMLTSTGFLLYLRWENHIRDAGRRDDRYNLPADEVNNLGDDDPKFRFTL
ncbi:uncharacterized protein Z518_09727 [Rhinocladiella mackenziei CBS 650.93]|uniref:Rhinocladiella mackenziei CBS 650.93 unplaced genomic scaffold supercont1.8, whole genome shotgun sequence n=1 Tax=Rhinocladiella mackenziei CBS 650.93 TaxID=1442369 RepID=A0A0D2FF68_9EURO|nr:uncharacterized protein Z518_09727 [Rhinocladiella mackenziei CBS 650.93]KIX00662.1 hypothetical protein Z518_09727 [Rhinocladiella mackenziei CBS 650.93]